MKTIEKQVDIPQQAQNIIDHFFALGARIKIQDYDNLVRELEERERIAREEEREQLIKYDLYGEARALDIPMDIVRKLQEALNTPLEDKE